MLDAIRINCERNWLTATRLMATSIAAILLAQLQHDQTQADLLQIDLRRTDPLRTEPTRIDPPQDDRRRRPPQRGPRNVRQLRAPADHRGRQSRYNALSVAQHRHQNDRYGNKHGQRNNHHGQTHRHEHNSPHGRNEGHRTIRRRTPARRPTGMQTGIRGTKTKAAERAGPKRLSGGVSAERHSPQDASPGSGGSIDSFGATDEWVDDTPDPFFAWRGIISSDVSSHAINAIEPTITSARKIMMSDSRFMSAADHSTDFRPNTLHLLSHDSSLTFTYKTQCLIRSHRLGNFRISDAAWTVCQRHCRRCQAHVEFGSPGAESRAELPA